MSNKFDLSRRTLVRVGAGLPLGWALPTTRSAAATAESPYIETRSVVPDPQPCLFTVAYPGKAPLRLAGHYWYHSEAARSGRRCPAIVEFNPYRRRDGTLAIDSQMYPWFASNEYLCFRLDLQGTGDSEGIMDDEYSDEELSYCVQAIEQIARHPLCDGQVGLMGISWSAINSLMVAARADCPRALKAVVAASGTDDRFNDDVHYLGGAMMLDNITWPATMWGLLPQPPDPDVVGPGWREMWRQRLQASEFWFERWASHQTRDAYWSATSLRGHYDRIKVPVFSTSGWQDGYKNPVARLVGGLHAAGREAAGVLGPWGHSYPYAGSPGPQLDWLRYLVTHWWDRWLKGKTPDATKQWPQLLVWLGESREPGASPCYEDSGRWVGEDAAWAQRTQVKTFYLGAEHKLHEEAGAKSGDATYAMASTTVNGSTMFETGSLGACGDDDLPDDQAAIDEQAVTFDSEPLSADLDCFGEPVVTLNLISPVSLAALVVRLCEVSPTTGASRLVSFRFFNLCFRAGDQSQPQALEPGLLFTVRIPLNILGHTFKSGWRIRLSLSSSLFPVLWQVGTPAALQIHTGQRGELAAASLTLPGRAPRDGDDSVHALASAAPPDDAYSVDPEEYAPTLKIDRVPQATRSTAAISRGGKPGIEAKVVIDRGRILYGGPLNSLWTDQIIEQSYQVLNDDPRSWTCTTHCTSTLERPSTGWRARAATTTKVWAERNAAGVEVWRYRAEVATFTGAALGQVGEPSVDEPFEAKVVEGEIVRRWS